MKTKHIIAIGLLSALAIGILGLAIYTRKAKTKTLQTNATYTFTDITKPNTDQNNNNCLNYTIAENYYINLNNNNIRIKTNNAYEITYLYNQSNNSYYQNVYITISTNQLQVNGITYPFELEVRTATKQIITNQNLNTIYFVYNSFSLNDDTFNLNVSVDIIYNNNQTDTTTLTFENININDNTSETYSNSTRQFEEIPLQTISGIYQYGANQNTAGYNTGYTEGQTTGYNTGYTAGETAGYNTGYTEALTDNQEEIYQQGYNVGYGIGYNDSEAFNHPIDLAGTMLQVLTMPFTFISQAFDVTLWPGTQYQINIGNFIKAMLAISAILFIIKLFTSGFSIIGNYTNNINREAKLRSDNRKSKQAWKSQKIAEKGSKSTNKE